MTSKQFLNWRLLALAPILMVAACGGGGSGSAGAAGNGANGGNGAGGGGGGTGGPVFGGTHPRILMAGDNLARLKASFATSPVASGFTEMVNQAMGGENIYGFEGYFAALLYRLTGNESYATFAVSFVDAKVAAEEALINQGMPEVKRTWASRRIFSKPWNTSVIVVVSA